ncbi:beta-galactosidase [Sphaerochaeta pleomorpha str. Grapes]|uniref:Beta-glucosidase n=1 Tax=Sphaerochaeta pleomorpha (strain ATCC BAA-1885 / DSM 22778 / Grapes) TaxID=158190 RepID=G8QYI0_SPHPG|nr:GH1 family beta-glucosidase [Sphaerochaeta pleomorpha]AEV28543.1 beta-galactosidase [Sphaerochaeta pleomorpha str. Grapes]
MQQVAFCDDFLWGCATASYQVEGAIKEDGRKPSIWDTFSKQEGAVLNGDDGAVAADQYHLYKQDVKLMSKLGFQAYRFSISWPRVIPDGVGEVNIPGLQYYIELSKELKLNNIKVVATLYHWDLPQSLQDKGGWANRDTSYAFAAYAKTCFTYLGEYVDQWITLNEPYCSAYLGYLQGIHAPGIKDLGQANKAVHHLNLAHGLAVAEYRKIGLSQPIGITLNPILPRPATRRDEDRKASEYARAFETDVFLLPLLGKGYPSLVTKDLGISYPVVDGDMDCIAQEIDFFGINYYQESAVSYDDTADRKYKNEPVWQPVTNMEWPVTPYGLLRILHYFDTVSNGMALYITENGCASDDVVENGRVHDLFRCQYLNKHLAICKQAIDESVNLKGYFVWSFIDNFEWAWGYSKRFGIVYDDYASQQRIPKDSAYLMRDVIAGYCEF